MPRATAGPATSWDVPGSEVLGFLPLQRRPLKEAGTVGTRGTVRTWILPRPSHGGWHASGQVSPLREGKLTLAFRSTCPRQGEPPAGWLFLSTAALFTGTGPSASLVSQLDMGELSRVRCLKTGDCQCRQKTPREVRPPDPQHVPAGDCLF